MGTTSQQSETTDCKCEITNQHILQENFSLRKQKLLFFLSRLKNKAAIFISAFAKNVLYVNMQVVWKDSKEIGMARAKTPDGKNTYVVSRYRPAGNMLGNFEENVMRR
jgi:hypothetical protein